MTDHLGLFAIWHQWRETRRAERELGRWLMRQFAKDAAQADRDLAEGRTLSMSDVLAGMERDDV